jgi:hypothetical protein
MIMGDILGFFRRLLGLRKPEETREEIAGEKVEKEEVPEEKEKVEEKKERTATPEKRNAQRRKRRQTGRKRKTKMKETK